MATNERYDDFVKAYNNFDSQPLHGEQLEKFYVDDFTKELTEQITTTIRITERFKKMLIIGHRGCGKSTILNKVAEDLKNEYHMVNFSAADVLNLMDVEPVDILLATYLQVLSSVKEEPKFSDLLKRFNDLMEIFKKKIHQEEDGINLLKTVSFKFTVEPESRAVIRRELLNQIEALQDNLSKACEEIRNNKEKDVLVIIDDLDKLETESAEKIFFENSCLLTLPQVKIAYTFPLDAYYCDAYIRISDRYAAQFIPVVNLFTPEKNYLASSNRALAKLILRRIDRELVSDDALKYMIDMSGGLLRDLVKFMQDACKLALVDKKSVIDRNLAEEAVSEHINNYYRIFDFPKYAESIGAIGERRKTLDNETLVYLLRYLFALEYRHGKKNLWYGVHPCLDKALERNAS